MSLAPRSRVIFVVLFVLIAAVGCLPSALAQGEKLGLLRINRVDYPVQVPRSYSFAIRINVEYAFRDYFEIQAAIYEGPRGVLSHPLWTGEVERLFEVGERIYDVRLESPSTERQWTLTCYVFYRDASGLSYFTDNERGPGFSEVSIRVADNARLTLQTPHGSMPVYLDGSAYSTDKDGLFVRELKVLTEHTIAVPANVSMSQGWRAFFHSWNRTDDTNPKTLLITHDLTLTADFLDEFYLNVVSDHVDVKGAGWYPSGAIANFSAPSFAPSKSWDGFLGVRWRFVGWSGDVESFSPNESIVMDRPHRVAANWISDYEQIFYLIFAVAIAVCVASIFLVRRRVPRTGPAEPAGSPARTFCMFCGSDIDPNARFCSKCGKAQVS